MNRRSFLRVLALMVARLLTTPPPIIRILTPTYNPQMLYNHAIAFKGWHKLEGEGLLARPMPSDFADLIVKVLVQRTLSKKENVNSEHTL